MAAARGSLKGSPRESPAPMSGAGPKGGAQGNDKGPGERRFIFAFLASVDRFLPFFGFFIADLDSPILFRALLIFPLADGFKPPLERLG